MRNSVQKPEHVRRAGRRKDLEARRRDGIQVTQADYDDLSDHWQLPREKLPEVGGGCAVLIPRPAGPFDHPDGRDCA